MLFFNAQSIGSLQHNPNKEKSEVKKTFALTAVILVLVLMLSALPAAAWSGGYGAWSGGYGAWSGGYGMWSGGYGAWSGGYGAWSGGYGAWSGGIDYAD